MAKKPPDSPSNGSGSQGETALPGDRIYAAARRYRILEEAKRRGEVTAQQASDEGFWTAAYQGRIGEDSIREDFLALSQMCAAPMTFQAGRDRVECRPRQAFANAKWKYGKEDPRKRAIAELIVKEYIPADSAVVYLSTGTSVFEVADVLLNAVDAGKKIDKIVTDNLAVVDLFCRRAQESPRIRGIKFTIIGGIANFDEGDIELPDADTFSQLRQCHYTTAIVSATRVDRDTGTICSSRQTGTKKQFFKDIQGGGVVVSQLIIPVTSEKILGERGGDIIYTPGPAKKEGEKKHVIVTDELPDGIKVKLDDWYTVRVARPSNLDTGV